MNPPNSLRKLLVASLACLITSSTTAFAQVRYSIIDLTERAQHLGVVQAEATAINQVGQIVGYELLPEFRTRAIFWDADATASLPEILPGDNSSWTHGLNNVATVAGVSTLVTIERVGHQIRIFEDNHPVTWTDGLATTLRDQVVGGDPIDIERAWDINDHDWIIGWGRPAGQSTGSKGWLFDHGILTDLAGMTQPVALNHNGQIVGFSFGSQSKAYLWDNGALTNLHEHPSITGVTSRAWGLNEAGLIVGEVQFHISQPEVATLWRNGQPINLLGHLFGRPQGVASAVNNQGAIIGWVNDLDNPNDETRAFLLEGEQFSELIDHIEPGQGWEQLIIAWDINDRGQIVGGGRRFGELGHAFLLTPLATCDPCDMNCDGDVDALDIEPFLGLLFGGAVPCDQCTGDVNGDGNIDASDIEPFLQCLFG